MGVAGEASKVDSMLKEAMNAKMPFATVQQKVTEMGFEMKPDAKSADPAAPTMSGKGQDHMAVIYRTWLTLEINSGSDGNLHGYHLDRAGKLF